VVTVWPPDSGEFDWIGELIGTSMRRAIGLDGESIVMLDGLVSLWQVDRTQ
jgi:hypothetical protein